MTHTLYDKEKYIQFFIYNSYDFPAQLSPSIGHLFREWFLNKALQLRQFCFLSSTLPLITNLY